MTRRPTTGTSITGSSTNKHWRWANNSSNVAVTSLHNLKCKENNWMVEDNHSNVSLRTICTRGDVKKTLSMFLTLPHSLHNQSMSFFLLMGYVFAYFYQDWLIIMHSNNKR